MSGCFFHGDGTCSGLLERAHLIPKQRIKRELKYRLSADELHDVVWDPRVLVLACRRHHILFDAWRLRPLREALPEGVEEFARQWGFEAFLERDFR